MSNSSLTCRLSLIGSGTSWHATLLAEYLIEYMARIPVEAHYASEYRYHEPALQSGDVVFIVSMSGETADAVESLRQITKSSLGGKVLKIAVVNSSSSTLARECDLVINVQAGAEVLGLRIFNRSVLNMSSYVMFCHRFVSHLFSHILSHVYFERPHAALSVMSIALRLELLVQKGFLPLASSLSCWAWHWRTSVVPSPMPNDLHLWLGTCPNCSKASA